MRTITTSARGSRSFLARPLIAAVLLIETLHLVALLVLPHPALITTLDAEGVMVMREADAVRQDIRPLRIGLLNLMPNKIKTETQIARLLGATPLQVELTLVKITSHVARNTPSEHIISFYRDWEDVRAERFDGFIVTGAPVETLPFEQVTYWDELRRIFDGTQTTLTC